MDITKTEYYFVVALLLSAPVQFIPSSSAMGFLLKVIQFMLILCSKLSTDCKLFWVKHQILDHQIQGCPWLAPLWTHLLLLLSCIVCSSHIVFSAVFWTHQTCSYFKAFHPLFPLPGTLYAKTCSLPHCLQALLSYFYSVLKIFGHFNLPMDVIRI